MNEHGKEDEQIVRQFEKCLVERYDGKPPRMPDEGDVKEVTGILALKDVKLATSNHRA